MIKLKSSNDIIKDIQEAESKINNNLSIRDFLAVFKSVGWIIINISFCYFLKYLVQASFTDIATKKIKNGDSKHELKHAEDFIKKEGYVLLFFAYNVGSFLGKSLLTLYVVKQLFLTTLTLTLITVFYGVSIYFDWLHFYYQFGLLILVGFVSGINYCSGMYWLL